MKWGIAGATNVLGMLLATVAGAQEVQAPQWRVGTVCTFHMNEQYASGIRTNKQYDYTQTVDAVNGTLVSLTYASPTGSAKFTMTMEGNLVSYGTGSYSPYFPTLSFPLSPGKTWSGSPVMHVGQSAFPYEVSGKAVAWQGLQVGGKVYGVMKVAVKGTYRNGSQQGSVEQTVYYAPEVSRIVQEDYTLYALNGSPWRKETKQLVRCNN